MVNLRILAFCLTLMLCVSQSTAFWWWGSSEPSQPAAPPNPYPGRLYATYPRYIARQPQQPNDQHQIPVPSIPLQMPLQAHLEPQPNIHSVQLVSCLCPINQEEIEAPSPNERSMYVQHLKNNNQD